MRLNYGYAVKLQNQGLCSLTRLDLFLNINSKCEKEYTDWQSSCEKWKKEHVNHPNKSLFEKYNSQWKEMDKKLKAGHQAQDEKIQQLENEIFARETAPPSPPSFVKEAELHSQELFLEFISSR
jgi:hypothetical protein